ncbi:IBR finger domain protein [Beauveria brongniartii RCEF 3172]|uniref:IBR finger domain protein n=1 Tax=Beauveria brongniartii RCEF 3172 TaxID=1081107 RepID=A0A167BL69_9HYPO|nr:IBR finger domain protein [Beauveria brongniartii RCEF 3172]
MATTDVNQDVYAIEVLGLDAGITEDAIDADLVAKANSLGIASSTLQKRNTSSAFSSSTFGSTMDQTFSATSSSTHATPRSSIFAASSTDLAHSGAGSFALYDQFLAADDAPLEQVRFRKGSLPAANSSAQSLFSVSTHKSFSSVKSGFKSRSWWRKRTDPSLCKQGSHPVGTDCPEDWELEAVKKMGQSTNWKRCHSCHNLVNLPKGATHMVCRCKEELCHICGGIWDSTTGCPNLCGNEAELEKRQTGFPSSHIKDGHDGTKPQSAAQKEAEKRNAEKRSLRSPEVQALMGKQALELSRFCAFSARTRSSMQTRHATDKLALLERHAEEDDALKHKHNQASSALEDRQIAAEMELRATLEQTARSVKLRLKHMEAYCQGRAAAAVAVAAHHTEAEAAAGRVVTERNLKELGQQYTLRDGMERQQAAKINVMRERQARRMEELLDRHDAEEEALADRQHGESQAQAARCAAEEEALTGTLRMLQLRLNARWSLQLDVLCREREEAEGLRYGAVATPAWPQDQFYVEQLCRQ